MHKEPNTKYPFLIIQKFKDKRILVANGTPKNF